MAGAGKKTFTAGEVLTASDVNTYLMEQSVMVFGGTAARSSAIPTPSEGMVSYRSDIDNLELYNGSAWVASAGLVLVNKTDFTSVSSFSLNNVFTSDFQNYRVILNFSSNTATQTINARMRKSGTDNSASYYHQEMAVASTSVTSSRFNNINQFYVGNMDSGYPTSWNIEIYNPQVAARYTTLFSQAPKFTSGQGYMFYVEACEHQVADAYDGLSIIGTNNFSGTVRVYGYRN
jgi:hypothetical protein